MKNTPLALTVAAAAILAQSHTAESALLACTYTYPDGESAPSPPPSREPHRDHHQQGRPAARFQDWRRRDQWHAPPLITFGWPDSPSTYLIDNANTLTNQKTLTLTDTDTAAPYTTITRHTTTVRLRTQNTPSTRLILKEYTVIDAIISVDPVFVGGMVITDKQPITLATAPARASVTVTRTSTDPNFNTHVNGATRHTYLLGEPIVIVAEVPASANPVTYSNEWEVALNCP